MEELLKKVDSNLFEEPYKDGKPFKWRMRPRPVWLILNNVLVGQMFRADDPELTIADLMDENKSSDKSPSEQPKESEEPYSDSFGWRLRARATVENDLFGIIQKDGTRSGAFREIDFSIRPTVRTEEPARGVPYYGSMTASGRPTSQASGTSSQKSVCRHSMSSEFARQCSRSGLQRFRLDFGSNAFYRRSTTLSPSRGIATNIILTKAAGFTGSISPRLSRRAMRIYRGLKTRSVSTSRTMTRTQFILQRRLLNSTSSAPLQHRCLRQSLQ